MNIFDIPVRRPRIAVAVGFVITCLAIASLFRMHAQTQVSAIFNPKNPTVKALQHTLEDFPVADQLLVMVSNPNGSKQPIKLENFAKRFKKRLTDKKYSKLIKTVDYSAGKEFIDFFKQQMLPNALYYLDKSNRQKLRQRLSAEGMTAQLKRMRQQLSVPGVAGGALGAMQSKDPLNLHQFWQARLGDFSGMSGGANFIDGAKSFADGKKYFLSKDSNSLLIRIEAVKPPGDISFSKLLVSTIKKQISNINVDNLKVQIAGAYAIASYDAGKIKHDSIWELFTTIFAIAVLLLVLYRYPIRVCLFAFVPVVVGVVWGFGIYSLIWPSITPLGAVIGGAICGIGIDYPIHFLLHYQNNRAKYEAREAARHTLSYLGKPTFIAWLTSVLGFAAVGISPIGVLRDFSLIGALGLLGVGVVTFALLPATLVLLDGKISAPPALPRIDIGKKIGNLILRRTLLLPLFCSGFLVVVVIYILLTGIPSQLSSNLLALHPSPSPPLEAQRNITKVMDLPSDSLFVHLRANSENELIKLAHKTRRRLAITAKHSSAIEGSFGLASLLTNPNSAKPKITGQQVAENFHAALASVGYSANAFSKYLTFVQSIVAPKSGVTIKDLLKYPKIARLVLPKKALEGQPATQALVMVKLSKSLGNRKDSTAVLSTLNKDLEGMNNVTLTGPAVLSADIQSSMQEYLPWQIGIALILIFLCLLWYSRSFLISGLIFIPTIFGVLCVFAYMNLANQQWNLINAVMAPVLFGITVDYGVFAFAMHKNGEIKELYSVSAAAFTCAATTVLGWGSLITTSIPAIRSLGVLIAIGVAAALVGDLFVLFPLLVITSRRILCKRK